MSAVHLSDSGDQCAQDKIVSQWPNGSGEQWAQVAIEFELLR